MNKRSKKEQDGITSFLNYVFALIVWTIVGTTSVTFAHADTRVLVLYDTSGPYSDGGISSAILLQNLLGHFNAEVTLKPVTDYSTGEMAEHLATFYLGTIFDELSYYSEGSQEYEGYMSFLDDAAITENRLVWMNYNLWHLNERLQVQGESLISRFGFTFNGVNNSGFNRIEYKGTELFKGVVPFANPGAELAGCIDEGDGKYACSTELNEVSIDQSSGAKVHAVSYSTLMPEVEKMPFVTQSGNFWFVGDIPFVHFSEEDRYLAFADLLHDMLGIYHQESHKGLLRLEDISAGSDLYSLQAVAEYLEDERVPFSIATIAYHFDGNYWYTLSRSKVGEYLRELTYPNYYGRKNRVSIVAHGASHQSIYSANPYDGVTGNDFEFYRVTKNGDNSLNFVSPLPGDSERWALNRMYAAYKELWRTGLKAFAWEAPHYTASKKDYMGIHRLYPVHFGRVTYSLDKKREVLLPFRRQHFYRGMRGREVKSPKMLGQFFPYPIYRDTYGYQIVPESIGYYEPEPDDGYRSLYPEDLIRHAKKQLVVRDGVAGFFYHPPLGIENLKRVVEGMRGLGYTFIPADQIFPHRR